ncbi:MAG TPA: class I SAM-dependent methyltransferase [Myxococcota bacterium]|nr:class I SAM-dependent methyltransferase [Myxococcota bacterium]
MDKALHIYRELLERWRKAMDLVGPGSVNPHFEDSQKAVAKLPVSGRWADLGSGAGFPGVVLAAAFPEAQVELVERRQKRATFLETVVAAAGLKNAQVRCVDSAELPAGAYDGLISRAYKPPAELLPEGQRLLRPGGYLALMLATEEAPEAPGYTLFHVERYTVEGKARKVVVLRKREEG